MEERRAPAEDMTEIYLASASPALASTSTQALTPLPSIAASPAPLATAPLSRLQLTALQPPLPNPSSGVAWQASGSNGLFSSQNCSQIEDVSLAAMLTTLQILNDAIQFMGIPYLSEAATLALSILKIIQVYMILIRLFQTESLFIIFSLYSQLKATKTASTVLQMTLANSCPLSSKPHKIS
jgi:hypothetical protein